MAVFQMKDRNVPRILITECLAEVGIELLRRELPEALVDQRFGLAPAQLRAVIGGYTAMIVHSETRVTDDLRAASRRGVLVVHAPGGNMPALAEHSMALLLALARHIPPANSSLKAGKWKQSRLVGMELSNKTLGILGLGKVGSERIKQVKAGDRNS